MSKLTEMIKAVVFKWVGDQGIGKMLLVWILLFSSLLTAILTALQLYIDYRVDVTVIENRLDEIERSYKGSIEASLWNVDVEQLDIQLEGIMQLPDIQAVIVEEKENVDNLLFLSKGDKKDSRLFRTYDLIRAEDTEQIYIGSLYVEASLDNVYERLINKAVTILLVQGIKTFFVSFFILFIVYRLVTRHIITIGYYLKQIDLSTAFPKLTLDRHRKAANDELDNLVDAYNQMTENLCQAYDDIRVVNERLKKDIAARKKAEGEVHMLNEELDYRVKLRTSELEAANKELNAFCYSVSHDLRAPLRRIHGFQSNLTTECANKLDQQALHYLSRMDACIKEMNAMIDSFLVLSKSTSTELNFSPIDLSAIVQHHLQRLAERDPGRRVELHVQDRIIANCDPRLTDLLVSNLIENAWKYTAKKQDAKISFYRQQQGQETVYIIEDNGVGFDMEFATHLFAPFVRLHKLSDFQGVGIGLATVKRVAARHGGRVWAESAINEGAKFFFTLKRKGF